jgi:hypothetical protein
MWSSAVPPGVPILSRGRHRTPRRGACFMEFASYLAGERWSDHPSCTHPLLAQLARQVNDRIGDAERQRLVMLIPLVVGRRGDEHTWIRLPVAVVASTILDVPEPAQRVLAAGLLQAEQRCAAGGPDLAGTGRDTRAALDLVPGAEAWVESLGVRGPITDRTFADRCAPTMVRRVVDGVVESGAPDRDLRLRALLEVALATCPAPRGEDSAVQHLAEQRDRLVDGGLRAR